MNENKKKEMIERIDEIREEEKEEHAYRVHQKLKDFEERGREINPDEAFIDEALHVLYGIVEWIDEQEHKE